jgi:hypothetical protein
MNEKQDKNQKDQLFYMATIKLRHFFKCISQLFNEAATYDRQDRTKKAIKNLSLRKSII